MTRTGTQLLHLQDRFTERTLIVRGNFAASYRAIDAVLGRPVFLKLLHADLSDDPDIRKRFEREARAAARLSHRCLVQLHEFGEDPEEGMYMVFEWIEGESLAARLAREKTLDAESVRDLARDLLEGLAVLHAAGVIHRDIKPENILLAKDGGAKLADYSLAIPVDEPRMTHHRAIIGTPAYMSPEQASGKSPDERADLFSVGVVLWEAAIGNNPFWAEEIVESLRRVRQVDPDYTSAPFYALPFDLQALLRSCLAKDAAQRPQSAREALHLIHAGPAIHKGKQRGIWMMAAAILMVAGLCLLMIRKQPSRSTLPATVPRDSLHVNAPIQPSEAQEIRDSSGVATALPLIAQKTKPNEKVAAIPPGSDSVNVVQPAVMIADSADVVFEVQPWARVYLNDTYVGTTPFRSVVRLPCGVQHLSFQNTQLPQITLALEIRKQTTALKINLAEHLSLLDIAVSPWGTLSIDGELLGATPLKRPVFLVPGSHTIRISHPTLQPVEQSFSTRGGDTLHLSADMDHSTLSVTRSDGTHL